MSFIGIADNIKLSTTLILTLSVNIFTYLFLSFFLKKAPIKKEQRKKLSKKQRLLQQAQLQSQEEYFSITQTLQTVTGETVQVDIDEETFISNEQNDATICNEEAQAQQDQVTFLESDEDDTLEQRYIADHAGREKNTNEGLGNSNLIQKLPTKSTVTGKVIPGKIMIKETEDRHDQNCSNDDSMYVFKNM